METLLTYIIKSGGLLAGFFLIYHVLLRKETFFNLNRWFLLSGLLISTLLPLYIIEREIAIERPNLTIEDLLAMAQPQAAQKAAASAVEPVAAGATYDWLQWLFIGYWVVCGALFLHVVCNLFSLYRLLRRRTVMRKEDYALIDIDEEIAPFSFFRYIVLNSSLYNERELESILNHEKVHSRERHSFDVLFVRLFCIAFWFNPIIWCYRKAVAQNLEYIADRRAVSAVSDRRAYQLALLRVAGNPNSLSLTNPFYQSLIKKRIVMLNKNESSKRNLWRYTVILPVIVAFLLCFQVKLIAKEAAGTSVAADLGRGVTLIIDKNTSDSEIKEKVASLKKEHGITVKVSKVKRNSSGEITGIKVEYKDKDGRKGVSQVSGDEPISPIRFYKQGDRIGFGGRGPHVFLKNSDDMVNMEDFGFNFELPEAPEAPEDMELPEPPEAPEAFEFNFDDKDTKNFVFSKSGDKEPVIIINGKKLSPAEIKDLDPTTFNSIKVFTGDDATELFGGEAGDGAIVISTENLRKITDEAIEDAKEQVKRAKVQVEMSRPQIERRKKQILEARVHRNGDQQAEMEKARAEMQKAKEELLKAKEEMEKAKEELEKAKSELKKKA